jgi:hypothetical protein
MVLAEIRKPGGSYSGRVLDQGFFVIPVQAGIETKALDSRLHGND